MRTLLFGGILLFSSPAFAGPVDDARLEYIAGNYTAALEVLRPAAEAGDPNAQNIMGDAYDGGNGVEVDYQAARSWWEKSAAQGYSKGLYNLGRMLSWGREGVAPEPDKGEEYLSAAAKQGNGDAYNEIGLLYAYGRGRPADAAKALEFYLKGHELGSRVATSNIGSAYASGLGVEVDYAKGFEYTAQAAELGHDQAIHNLGVFYRDGLHVQANQTVAYLLFVEAQKLGYPKAGQQVADFLLIEDSPRHDPVTALAYCRWSEAAAADHQQGDLFLNCDEVAEVLSEDDRAAASRITEALLQ